MSIQEKMNHSVYYHRKNMRLAESLIIKSETTSFLMNGEVNRLYSIYNMGKVVDDAHPSTWRYYKHLNGDYHEIDLVSTGVMRVKSLDTLQMIDFTKENLSKHRATLAHYASKGEYYHDLLEQYPEYFILINGICRPVDFDTAYNKEEYSILAYDDSLVEPQEFFLLTELEKHIKHTMHQFHSHNYSVYNDRYEAMRLGVLGAHLPAMIIAIREQYVNTVYAHSFHIWNYLASRFELDRYRQYLMPEQVMWLYRNVRYLDINSGKTNNFDKLLEHLFSARNLPLFEFNLTNQIDDRTGKRNQMNLLDSRFDRDENISPDELFGLEDRMAPLNADWKDRSLSQLGDKFDRSEWSEFKTKLIEVYTKDYNSRELYPLGGIAVNEWAYLAFNNRYDLMAAIYNPENGETMTLNSKEAFIIWMYLLVRLFNPGKQYEIDQMHIPIFYAHGILNQEPEVDSWKNMPPVNLPIDYPIDDIISKYPVPEIIYSSNQFYRWIKSVHHFKMHAHTWLGALHDLDIYQYIKQFNSYMECIYPVDIDTPESQPIGEWIDTNGRSITSLKPEHMWELAVDIYNNFTAASERATSSVADMQRAMCDIAKQLSSYSLQFTVKTEGENARILDVPFIRVGRLHALEKGYCAFNRWCLAKVFNYKACDLGVIHLPLLFDDDELRLMGKDLGHVDPFNPTDVMVDGHGTSSRRVRTGLVRTSTVEPYPRDPLETSSVYYLYDGTIYQHSTILEEEAYLDVGKKGVPVEVS